MASYKFNESREREHAIARENAKMLAKKIEEEGHKERRSCVIYTPPLTKTKMVGDKDCDF